MKCPNCDKEIPSDSNFCEFCGMKLSNRKNSLWIRIILVALIALCIVGGTAYWINQRTKHTIDEDIKVMPSMMDVVNQRTKYTIDEDRKERPSRKEKPSMMDEVNQRTKHTIDEDRKERPSRKEKPSMMDEVNQRTKHTIDEDRKERPSIKEKPSMMDVVSEQDFTETAWGINMKMIWVEGGEFMMGCTSEQSDCDDNEKYVRRVTVDGFYIGMLEVTQSQWEKVVETNVYTQKNKAGGSNTYGVGPDYPMYYVNWEEAMEFCRLLSNKTGRTYTLPTEAQWEYAARGGKKADGTKYAGSNMIDVVAWYGDNSSSSTHPCGTKRANALGIYDMSGNVWEWCKDWYSNSYTSYDTNNPAGPSSGSSRVNRGGSWINDASYCRVADRDYYSPGNRGSGLGFRVVCLP